MPSRKKSPRKPSVRQQLVAEGLLQGKSEIQAYRDAGYAPKYAEKNAHHITEGYGVQVIINERLRALKSDTEEVHALFALHLRGDIGDFVHCYDENGSFSLAKAKEIGLSRLIKRIKLDPVPVCDADGKVLYIRNDLVDLELYPANSAAKELKEIFGMAKLPDLNPAQVAREEEARSRALEQVDVLIARLQAEKQLSHAEAVHYLAVNAPTLAREAGLVVSDAIQ